MVESLDRRRSQRYIGLAISRCDDDARRSPAQPSFSFFTLACFVRIRCAPDTISNQHQSDPHNDGLLTRLFNPKRTHWTGPRAPPLPSIAPASSHNTAAPGPHFLGANPSPHTHTLTSKSKEGRMSGKSKSDILKRYLSASTGDANGACVRACACMCRGSQSCVMWSRGAEESNRSLWPEPSLAGHSLPARVPHCAPTDRDLPTQIQPTSFARRRSGRSSRPASRAACAWWRRTSGGAVVVAAACDPGMMTRRWRVRGLVG
jgi:hypothetical protein